MLKAALFYLSVPGFMTSSVSDPIFTNRLIAMVEQVNEKNHRQDMRLDELAKNMLHVDQHLTHVSRIYKAMYEGIHENLKNPSLKMRYTSGRTSVCSTCFRI